MNVSVEIKGYVTPRSIKRLAGQYDLDMSKGVRAWGYELGFEFPGNGVDDVPSFVEDLMKLGENRIKKISISDGSH